MNDNQSVYEFSGFKVILITPNIMVPPDDVMTAIVHEASRSSYEPKVIGHKRYKVRKL